MTRDERIEQFIPLVHYLARKFSRADGCPARYDDLVGDGLVGLVRASDAYDPARGRTFRNYAWTRIVRSIRDGLRTRDPLTRGLRRQVNTGQIEAITHVEVDDHHAAVDGPNDRTIDVRRAVAALSPEERRTITTIYYREGLVQHAHPDYSRSWNSALHQQALSRLRTSLGAYRRAA